MVSCCTVKYYGDAFELIFLFNFFYSFYFILRNNGTAMAVLAAPLPEALLDIDNPTALYNGRSCNDMHMKHHHFPCEALN